MLSNTCDITSIKRIILTSFVLLFMTHPALAWQTPETNNQRQAKPKKPQPFRWVNPLKQELAGVKHAKFRSPSMRINVGYCIFLPPGYDDAFNPSGAFVTPPSGFDAAPGSHPCPQCAASRGSPSASLPRSPACCRVVWRRRPRALAARPQ